MDLKAKISRRVQKINENINVCLTERNNVWRFSFFFSYRENYLLRKLKNDLFKERSVLDFLAISIADGKGRFKTKLRAAEQIHR